MAQDEDLPASRTARTARFGGLVAGQSARWVGTRAANVLRSPENAERKTADRTLATAEELVTRLGEMKGAAMKIGQVLSTIDFDLVPEADREQFKEKLATLRDDAPRVPFAKQRKLMEAELGGPMRDHFKDFDEEPVAAASIGQVYRATTHAGRDVAVKVQYPGIAEAVDTDLRNLNLLLPLVKRLAPGLDAKAIAQELRDRIGEELDYEIEAQHQRTVHRAFRDHPFLRVPAVDTALSTRRVLVTEWAAGRPFSQVAKLPDEERDRFGEALYRFFFGLLNREGLAAGDPHPGNVLLGDDGFVVCLDFGLIRHVPDVYLAGERALGQAVLDRDGVAIKRWMAQLGYLPEPDRFTPERLLAQLLAAAGWWSTPGVHRLTPDVVREVIENSGSPRSEFFDQMRRQTVPPEALLIRRMESLLLAVLGELRAAADWRDLTLEVLGGQPARTELGRQEQAWLAASGRTPAALT